MNDFQTRVIAEQDELIAKISKLRTFLETPLFDNLQREERALLIRQEAAMTTYSLVLVERISHF